MKSRYILLKDTPEVKAGAIFEEDCDDGTQGFSLLDKSIMLFNDQSGVSYSRKTVIGQPSWFKKVDVLWLTEDQIKKVKKLLKI